MLSRDFEFENLGGLADIIVLTALSFVISSLGS
jgi:hypothetical protein